MAGAPALSIPPPAGFGGMGGRKVAWADSIFLWLSSLFINRHYIPRLGDCAAELRPVVHHALALLNEARAPAGGCLVVAIGILTTLVECLFLD